MRRRRRKTDGFRAVEARNSSRRGLSGTAYTGPCVAENPIDQCWRCKPDWAENRKQLADCAIGFAQGTTGGKDGEFYTVSYPSDDDLVNPKPGTSVMAFSKPSHCGSYLPLTFKIKLKAELIMTNDKTIDGRGAKVEITGGAGITILFAKNVIIHNIKIHGVKPGSGGLIRDTADHFGRRNVDDGDCIQVLASSNIWIDHLSMWNCKDGMIDVVSGSTAITISNGHFTRHDHMFLFGANDNTKEDEKMQITLAFNHFGKGLVQRMPSCRRGFFHVVNNDHTHWLMYAIGGSANPTIISQGNRFIAPPNKPEARIVDSYYTIRAIIINALVTHRNDAPESEWKNWMWRSENDQFQNGAFFVESGAHAPLKNNLYGKQLIGAKDGSFVKTLTRFSGFLKCIKGKAC